MEEKFNDNTYDRIVKRYIDGKSIESLKNYLNDQGLTTSESIEILTKIHLKFSKDRIRRAKKDLAFALVLISINLIPVILILVKKDFSFRFGFISIAAVFAWRPFLASYITVMRDKKKIDLMID